MTLSVFISTYKDSKTPLMIIVSRKISFWTDIVLNDTYQSTFLYVNRTILHMSKKPRADLWMNRWTQTHTQYLIQVIWHLNFTQSSVTKMKYNEEKMALIFSTIQLTYCSVMLFKVCKGYILSCYVCLHVTDQHLSVAARYCTYL